MMNKVTNPIYTEIEIYNADSSEMDLKNIMNGEIIVHSISNFWI